MANGVFPNPMKTTTAAGSFPQGGSSKGYIQGCAMPDPAFRNSLRSGYVDPAETLPMWGGLGITDNVPGVAGGPAEALGSRLARSTAIGNLTGFTVWDQAHHLLMFPNSPIPLAYNGMTMSYYALGSRIRIPLPIADADAAALVNGPSNVNIGWDYVNQKILIGVAANAALPLRVIDVEIKNSLGVNFDPVTGNNSWNPAASLVLVQLGLNG